MSLQPTEAELLREVIDSRLTELYTSIPARIVKYDATTQTADCEIVILRAETAESGATVHETYPVIPNVPVGWMSGGGYSLQFPLNKGDGVWLMFSMAATANWRETGEVSPPGDRDLHDISYPIAIPCARHNGQALPVATGALLTVPPGGSFNVSTGGGTPEPAALASKVNANFDALLNLLQTWTVVPNDGGAALKTAAALVVLQDTSSIDL